MGELEGTAEAAYEGLAMLLAAVVVTWMVFWMRKQAATIGAPSARAGERLAAPVGGWCCADLVAFVGVAREGVETALFLFASSRESGPAVGDHGGGPRPGGRGGLGVAFYRGALRLDLRRFFMSPACS